MFYWVIITFYKFKINFQSCLMWLWIYHDLPIVFDFEILRDPAEIFYAIF